MYKIKRFNGDKEESKDDVFEKPKWKPKNEDNYSPIKEDLRNRLEEIKNGNG